MDKKVTSPPKPPLSPQDIRAIREGLGLSQAEAGEILGGGPRAFTKYEAGTIKPAQSVANLLRLLADNPGVLSTLTGRKSVPLADSGQRPFEVTGKHVQALTDRTLAVVVRKTLSAEARAEGLPEGGVHVSGSITTPDGGEDGRIEWKGGPERTSFLPGRLTQLQLKAGRIGPGEAASEVLSSKSTVKSMVADVLSKGGYYVQWSAQQYVQKDIQEREHRIREALRAAGLTITDEQVIFRDADQLAQWVNRHPAVATWVLEHTQPGLVGPFGTWSHWCGRAEHDASQWVSDSRLSDVRDAVRSPLSKAQGVVRMVGPSGVGKSRLMLEALGPTDEEDTEGQAIADLVLYADEGHAGSANIKAATQHLALSGLRAVLVVDRCAPDTHEELENLVRRKGSRLSLATIDDDVPEEPLPTGFIKVGEAPAEVIEGIITNIVPGLPSEDQRRLVRFSRGFPKVANLVGRAWAQQLPLARATDETLVDNVLLGRARHGLENTRRVAELLGAFGRVRMDAGENSELSAIVKLGSGVDETLVRQVVHELARRGIVQRKGGFAVLQPRPIALRLAERQWRSWGPDDWDRVLGGDVPTELRIRAARQLALLNTTDTGQEVVKYVCRFGGPFATPEGLAGPGNAEVLSQLAEVDGQLVVQALEQALEGVDLDTLVGDCRRHLVWALEKIAFSPETFEEAAHLLLRLAVSENEKWANNATGQFLGLFQVLLGGTAAGPEGRLAFLDDVAKTNSAAQRLLVCKALLAGVKTSHFTRGVGAESHGARPALESWHPATWGEAWDYVRECLARLSKFAEGDDEAAAEARRGLANEFRSLVGRGFLDEVETVIEKMAPLHGYWPEALEALGDVLTYDIEGLDGNDRDRVRALIAKLEPRDWPERVRFFVTELPWDWPCDEKLGFEERGRRQAAVVEDLAKEIVGAPAELAKALQPLSCGRQRMSGAFGEALAKATQDPVGLLEELKGAITATPADERNFWLLAGFLSGLAEEHRVAVESFKADAANSDVFAAGLPLVCWRLGITAHDIELVISALANGLLRPHHLMQWTLGGVLAELPPPAVAPLFDTLFGLGEQGLSVGIDVLGMYVHGDADRLEKLRPQLRELAKSTGSWGRESVSQSDVHHFKEIMFWLLDKGRADSDASAVALELAKAAVSGGDYDRTRLLEPLMPTLLSRFPEIVWPLLGQKIIEGKLQAWRMQHLLGDSFSFDGDCNPALLQLPEETLFAWCYAHPDAAPAFAARALPVLDPASAEKPKRDLHPLMRRLIDEFGDREGVLEAIYGNMHTFGWTGSRSTYYALYEKPLASLLEHPMGKVRRWAKRVLQSLSSHIDDARNEDAEQEAEWD